MVGARVALQISRLIIRFGLIVTCLAYLTACQSAKKETESKQIAFELQVSENTKLHLLCPSNFQPNTQTNGEFQISLACLKVLPNVDPQTFIDRRQTMFKALFADEIEPYTNKKIERSSCLVKEAKDKVEFRNFDVASRVCSKKGNSLGLRLWSICDDRLVEITVNTRVASSSNFKINCEGMKTK